MPILKNTDAHIKFGPSLLESTAQQDSDLSLNPVDTGLAIGEKLAANIGSFGT